ncbi:MFS transporter [Alicyclobacillus sp.]|uniref:MFS transporter n=1 Tax=Alicyclobacillus sp. TaxID=61169 RepID=UPI0025BB936D|nr:MFS transporter [Alicyclobacillus sp.]MCL6517644.1 MFS transporter [Alicyclobacillus sp.]
MTNRTRWVALVGFALLVCSTQILWVSFAPITTQAARVMHTSPGLIGDLSALFPVVYIIMALPAGRWLDVRFSGALSAGALATGLPAAFRLLFPEHYAWQFTMQLILAAAQPLVINAISTFAAHVFLAARRPLAIAMSSVALFVGIVLAMVLSPVLFAAGGLRAVEGVEAIPALVAMGLVLITVRRIKRAADGGSGVIATDGARGAIDVDGASGASAADGAWGAIAADGGSGVIAVDAPSGAIATDGASGVIAVDAPSGAIATDGARGVIRADSETGVYRDPKAETIWVSLRTLLRDGPYWRLCGLLAIGIGLFDALNTWLEPILSGFGAGRAAGNLLALMTLSGIAGSASLPPWIARRNVRRGVMRLAVGLAMLMFLAMLVSQRPLWLGVWMIATGFLLLTCFPVILEWTERYVGATRQGIAVGFMMLFSHLLGNALIFLVQALLARPMLAIALLAGACAVGEVVAWGLPANVRPMSIRRHPEGPANRRMQA